MWFYPQNASYFFLSEYIYNYIKEKFKGDFMLRCMMKTEAFRKRHLSTRKWWFILLVKLNFHLWCCNEGWRLYNSQIIQQVTQQQHKQPVPLIKQLMIKKKKG